MNFQVLHLISGSEKGGTLFLSIAVLFGMKKSKNESKVKENIGYRNFFTHKKEKDQSII